MPIYAPGKRNPRGKKMNPRRKTMVALSLTAMVDMFTVLVVFLLQNYKATGEVLYLPKEVKLPIAQETKELQPAHVVTISNDYIFIDDEQLMDYEDVKRQKSWMVSTLYHKMVEKIRKDKEEYRKAFRTKAKKVVYGKKKQKEQEEEETKKYLRLTLQSDKEIDFLTVKKIMYTVTEAGIEEINFSVITDKRQSIKDYEEEFGKIENQNIKN